MGNFDTSASPIVSGLVNTVYGKHNTMAARLLKPWYVASAGSESISFSYREEDPLSPIKKYRSHYIEAKTPQGKYKFDTDVIPREIKSTKDGDSIVVRKDDAMLGLIVQDREGDAKVSIGYPGIEIKDTRMAGVTLRNNRKDSEMILTQNSNCSIWCDPEDDISLSNNRSNFVPVSSDTIATSDGSIHKIETALESKR